MAQASKVFRIFVSSPFSDLKAERNALQHYVFPRLRDLCVRHGCRFQAIDLRWGVSEEASLDQQTLRICLDEIARCRRVTPRPNFIVLLGDRYGWRPLPYEIPASEFQLLAQRVSHPDDEALLGAWYRRDDNAVPPVYGLQPRTGEFTDLARWEIVEHRLRSIILGAIEGLPLPAESRLKYVASATEQEIVHGALRVPDAADHVFGFFRTLRTEQGLRLTEDLLPGPAITDFVDLTDRGGLDQQGHSRLEDLKGRLRGAIPSNITEYEARWTGDGITLDHLGALPQDLDACLRLIEAPDVPPTLCAEVWRRLARVILKEIAGIATVDSLDKEIADHEAFGAERARFFIGRAGILQTIADYLRRDAPQPLVIGGASGSGKSALMARAVQQARETLAPARVIVRFIGATPSSADGRGLLDSLCHQISTLYGADISTLPTDYQDLVQEFPKRLALATAQQPLIVFLDALDQFAELDPAGFLNWLPVTLPAYVRLVVSLLPDDRKAVLERRLPGGSLVELQPLAPEEGGTLLDLWLRDAGRMVQPSQRDEVLGKFRGAGLPLYLRLAFEEARCWASYADPHRTTLSGDISSIIRHNLFARLSDEANHGTILVARSLGYLAAAKHGLAEDELLDVLSRDAEVLAAFRRRSLRSPVVDRLPVVVWSRLSFDLEPYLAEHAANGTTLLVFYHRQLREAVVADYLAGTVRTERHRTLAAYFEGQDLEFRRDGETIANVRKLVELPYQQRLAERWGALETTLTDFDFIGAKSRVEMVYDLLRDYADALSSWPASDEAGHERRNAEELSRYRDHLLRFARGEDPIFVPVPSKQHHALEPTTPAPPADELTVDPRLRLVAYRQFVASHAHLLAKWRGSRPIVLQLAFNSARGGPVAHTAERILARGSGPLLLEPAHLRRSWNPFPALIRTIEVHSESVDSLDFSVDGKQLLSLASGQMTLWQLDYYDNPIDRDIVSTGDREDVRAARLSGDAFNIVTLERSSLSVWTPGGACDQRITIQEGSQGLAVTSDAAWAATFRGRHLEEWDLRVASRHRSVETLSQDITAVAMSVDGRRIVTAHHDLVIRLHGLDSETPPTAIPLVGDEILAMRFTPDARLLLTYEKDCEYFIAVLGHSRAWELSLALGEAKVTGIAVATDASHVFVAQNNGIVRAFDLSTGDCIRTFRTACERIDLVALRRSDSQLVALSYDSDRQATEVWTLITGHCTQHITSLNDEPWTPQALLPDGNTLVSVMHSRGDIETLELRDLHTGHRVRPLGHWEQARSKVVVPHDGRRMFTGSWRNGILEWDLGTTTSAQTIGEAECTVREFDADAMGGVGVSSRSNEPIRIWDLQRRLCVREVAALSDWDAKVCISPDGRIAASGDHEFVLRVWDGRPGGSRMETGRLTGHRSIIDALALTPDGSKLMAGSWDTTARVLDFLSGEARVLTGHEDSVKFVSLSVDGKLGVSWALDKTLRVWDLATAQELKVLERSSEHCHSLSMTATGSRVATGDEHGRIKLWDAVNGRLEQRERRHDWFVRTVCMLPRSKVVVSGSAAATIGIWDLADRARDLLVPAGDRVHDVDPSKVQCIVPLADGFASAGQDNAIRIWDTVSRECVAVLRGGEHECNVAHLTATADGLYLVSASDNDEYIWMWDVVRRTAIRSIRITDHDGIWPVRAIALSVNGRTLVSLAETPEGSGMQLWDLQDGRRLRAVVLFPNMVFASARHTPRGDRVMIDSGLGDVELWDPMLGDRTWRIPGQLAALNPNGTDAVIASEDEMCRVNLATGEPILRFRGHKGLLSDLQVTADGMWVLSAGLQDRTVRVWNIDSGECVAVDALESPPLTLSRMSASGLVAYGTEAGEVLIRQVSGIDIGPSFVTPVRLWIADDSPHWDSHLVVRCPECARITTVPDALDVAISITSCPACATRLRLTPFVVDDSGRF